MSDLVNKFQIQNFKWLSQGQSISKTIDESHLNIQSFVSVLIENFNSYVALESERLHFLNHFSAVEFIGYGIQKE